jgi:transketolase
MRKQFVEFLVNEMANNKKIFLLTGDLGYGILDRVRDTYPERFLNVGSSEQLMIGLAVGLSYEGFIPICYSITPFVLYRPFEMIRNYVDYENTPIKLVGTGRDKDYTDQGITHWAEDDLKVLSCFDNIHKLKPEILTLEIFNEFMYNGKPTYLNLSRN